MTVPGLSKLASWPRLPRRTVRLRLTLLYGSLFAVSGAALLAITYLLVSHATAPRVLIRSSVPPLPNAPPAAILPPSLGPEQQARLQELQAQAAHQHASELHQLLIQSGIALGIMLVTSIVLGWLVAGRVLRPVRTMTATTRQISHEDLHQRLALQGPRDELTDLGDTIDGLLARLEAAFDAQRRFVANASHELRTPLAMMRTSLDVAAAKTEPGPEEVTNLEAKLREGLDQADGLLESFLTLARAQHGAFADQSTVSLDQAIRAAMETQRQAIRDKGINVEERLNTVWVKGSEALLWRMAANIIENAVRHNHRSGWVGIETAAREGRARLVVKSDGPQLEESRVAELTQPFRRHGAERTGLDNGFGLGLSIVSAIVSAHDGGLELHARPQGGLEVLIDLPLASPNLGDAGQQ